MRVFNWNDILTVLNTGREEAFFAQGTGISVGSFDGLHKGHRTLLSSLVNNCKKNGLLAGVVSFKRPLPSIKHSGDYRGDVTTLDQRLKLFETLGLDFAIIVDFTDDFASMLGADFLNILVNACNMELLAEGIDFRCGYKGATDAQAIKYFAEKNNVKTIFVDPVYYKEGTDEEERVSSSFIRSMILKGFFATCNELLERSYKIDLTDKDGNSILADDNTIPCSALNQVIPPAGIYHCSAPDQTDVRVEITPEKILLSKKTNSISFN